MYIPKIYGQSKIEKCPFCGLSATSKNSQGVATCNAHKEEQLPDMKCACGQYLDMKTGKFGVFFNCLNCGTINLRKALEMNNVSAKFKVQGKQISKEQEKREQTVTSDDPRFFS